MGERRKCGKQVREADDRIGLGENNEDMAASEWPERLFGTITRGPSQMRGTLPLKEVLSPASRAWIFNYHRKPTNEIGGLFSVVRCADS